MIRYNYLYSSEGSEIFYFRPDGGDICCTQTSNLAQHNQINFPNYFPSSHPVLLMALKKTLSAVDYVLFFGSLLLTLLVGMYQAWKGRRDSAEEMLVSSKGLSLSPVVLSLAATYLSAIVLLGKTNAEFK